jgi:hypothetical protein
MFFNASLITAQGHGQNGSKKAIKLARVYAVFLLCLKKSKVSACFSSKQLKCLTVSRKSACFHLKISTCFVATPHVWQKKNRRTE